MRFWNCHTLSQDSEQDTSFSYKQSQFKKKKIKFFQKFILGHRQPQNSFVLIEVTSINPQPTCTFSLSALRLSCSSWSSLSRCSTLWRYRRLSTCATSNLVSAISFSRRINLQGGVQHHITPGKCSQLAQLPPISKKALGFLTLSFKYKEIQNYLSSNLIYNPRKEPRAKVT